MTRHVVISYSMRHYTPGVPIREGIGNVAKTLHEAIISNFPDHVIIYTDPSHMDDIDDLTNVDWLFSVPRDLVRAQRKFKPTKTVLFSANESALSRFEVWVYSRKEKINRKLMGGHDGIYEDFREYKADFVISLGGWNSYVSFLRSGFSQTRVITTGIKYQNPLEKRAKTNTEKYVIWFMGLICIRKGILNLPSVLKMLDETHPELKLKLVGFTDSEELKQFIQYEMSKSAGNHIWHDTKIFHGTPEWGVLREDVAVGIFPSREEGLPGCVIDLINLQVPVIYSSKCGLPYINEEISEIDFLHPNWPQRLSNLLQKDEYFWYEIIKKQETMAFFAKQDNQIDRIINRLSNGKLWPSFSGEKNTSSDFTISSSALDKLDLIINYRGPKLSEELQIRMLILELDRNSDMRSAGFREIEAKKSELYLSLTRRESLNHLDPRNIDIFVVDENESLKKFGILFALRKKAFFATYFLIGRARRLVQRG